jgi:hypothetical protein
MAVAAHKRVCEAHLWDHRIDGPHDRRGGRAGADLP